MSHEVRRRAVWLLAVLCLAAGSAWAQGGGFPSLDNGKPLQGEVSAAKRFQTYTVEVGADAAFLEIVVTSSHDVDLFVKFGSPIETSYSEAIASSATTGSQERVCLRKDGDPALQTGRYYVDVAALGDEPVGWTFEITARWGAGEPTPGPSPEQTGEVPHRNPEATTEADVDGSIKQSSRFDLTISGERHYRTFVVQVPEGCRSLLIKVEGAPQDMDLYLRHGAQMEDWELAPDHKANGNQWDESIRVDGSSSPALRAGKYYLDVARVGEGDAKVQMTVQFDAVGGGGVTRNRPEPFGGPEPSEESGVDGVLRGEASFDLRIDDDRNYRTYILLVPESVQSLAITVESSAQDMDLYLRRGAQMENWEDAPDYKENGKGHDELLYVDRDSTPPLMGGRYYLDVAQATEGSEPARVTVSFDVPRPEAFTYEGPSLEVVQLVPGVPTPVRIDRRERKFASFRVDVPAGTQSLHICTMRSDYDIDLYVKHGSEIADYETDFDHKAYSTRLNEYLHILPSDGGLALASGTYFIDVVSFLEDDDVIELEILATLNELPSESATDLPLPPYPHPQPLTPIEQAICAVVEVDCDAGAGSGSCLTPDGYILTAYHVVELEDGKHCTEGIYVAFCRDFDQLPLQAFEAECVWYDAGKDLALLKVVRDVYGRAVPTQLALPYLRLGDPDRLRIGDPLHIVGYPAVGGRTSRSTVSVTRGIISGFTRQDGTRFCLKTDARINAGNSGGAAVDIAGRLVGVPTEEITEEDDELGYCRLVTLIPEEWLAVIRERVGSE